MPLEQDAERQIRKTAKTSNGKDTATTVSVKSEQGKRRKKESMADVYEQEIGSKDGKKRKKR